MNVSLKCRCGAMRGVAYNISSNTGSRIVCYCDDCQAYAHFLGQANEVLDMNGGTEVFPVVPSKLRFIQGIENLKCLRLSEKGLYRWYAGCCNTPIANSMPSYRVPFAGVVKTIMDHAADHKTRDEALGPIRARVQGRFGVGALPKGTYQTASVGIILTTVRFLFSGWIRGQHQPSPFFDPSGRPVVQPYILKTSEREGLRSLCGPKRIAEKTD